MKHSGLVKKKSFSLIDLLMIIMVIGIIFVFVIPLRQDGIDFQKAQEAIKNIQIIKFADIAYKNDPELGDGDYAAELSFLNLKLEEKYFTYSVTDSTVVATSTEEFGVKGAQIIYNLPNGPWMTGGKEKVKDRINTDWLP